jgi:hypothetical protein
VSCIPSGISYPSSGISSIPSGISNRVRATPLGYQTCWRPAYSFHIHSQLFFRELFVSCIPSGISYPSSGISSIPSGISNRVRATPLGYLTCWRPAYSFHIHSQLFFRELFVSCIPSGISYPSSGISRIPSGISNRVRATPLGYLTCQRPAHNFLLFLANCVCVSTLCGFVGHTYSRFLTLEYKTCCQYSFYRIFLRIFLYCLHGRHHACSYDAAWEFHQPRTSFAGIPNYHRTRLVMM